jgi:hypothetical protein
VPEISRFFGIVIRMFVETGGPHHRPHFHAYYAGGVGIYAVDTVERIAGYLPLKQERLVLAWSEIHQAALLENWQRLQEGSPPGKIEPLR